MGRPSATATARTAMANAPINTNRAAHPSMAEPATNAPMRSAFQRFEVRKYSAVSETRPAQTGRICFSFSSVNICEPPYSYRCPFASEAASPQTDNHAIPKEGQDYCDLCRAGTSPAVAIETIDVTHKMAIPAE